MILNVGAGEMVYGDIRLDIEKKKTTNMVGDAEFLPFKSDAFDLVFSQCLLEHLPNPGIALKEQRRVCKRNGEVVLITDNAGFWGFYVYGVHSFPVIRFGKHGKYKGSRVKDAHYFLFTDFHLRNLFRFANLRVQEIRKIPFIPLKGQKESLFGKFLRVVPLFRNINYPRLLVIAKK